jgi:hypothetical protein
MHRAIFLAMLAIALIGCPPSNTPGPSGGSSVPPEPITTAAPTVTSTADPASKEPTITGNWSVHVTSEPPGINPDLLDTPEKKAKMLFDHLATAKGGKVVVEHKTLNETAEVDADAAAALDLHMTSVDWAAVMEAAKKDGATEGGTVFEFEIRVGDASWSITTTHLESHPELVKVVDAVKAATGRP